MIEKLSEYKITSRDGAFINVECNTKIINTLVRKLNELIYVVNGILAAQEQYATIYNEDIVPMLTPQNEEPADNSEKANRQENVQDRMIGCTTLDIPKSYKNDQLTLATLDYSKKLEKENSDLKDELERTRKALEIAKDTIRHADWFFDGDYNVDAKTMHNEIKCAIKGITALEQKG